MRSNDTKRRPFGCAIAPWLALFGALGCGGGEIPEVPEQICAPAEHRECDCPVGTGAQDCNVEGTDWGQCFCPIQNVVLASDALAVDVDDDAIVVDDTGGLRFPRAGHDDVASLAAGDVLVNWGDPPLIRRVLSTRTEGDTIVMSTRIAGLQEAFDELDIALDDAPINLYGGLPEGARSSFEIPRAGISGGPSGLTFAASGELMPSLDFSDDSRIWFEPTVSMHLRTRVLPWDVDFDFSGDLDAGFDLTSTVGLALEGRVSAEIELIEAIIANIVPPIRPPEIRVSFGPLYFAPKLILGCELEVNGEAELTSRVATSFDLGAVVSYDDDRRGDNWRSESHANVTGTAEMLAFDWQAGATLTCYIRPRIEATFLEVLTGYVEAGPEASASVVVGPTNQFSVDAAVVGTVGAELGIDVGEIEVTIDEREWEVFRESTNLYREEFTICGDGYRQEGDGDDFREQCDPGPASDPTCSADCTCGVGWGPVEFNPSAPGSYRSWFSETTMNVCIPTCGNGRLEADEGEVCDPGREFLQCQAGRMGCTDNCGRVEGLCGDGIVDARCGEVCDDGNTDDCDTCSSDCYRTRGCGNRSVDYACGESCDDGNTDDTDECTNGCRYAECGNGVLDFGEACDDGNIEDCDACHNDCTANTNTCGDLHVCGVEECDSGTEDTWNCDADCTVRTCGDDYLNAFEACEGPSATCDGDCTLARCGDGTVNALAGEACDGAGYACDDDCTLPECGDGVLNPARERCDDGNTEVCNGACASDCSALERTGTCGDGVVTCGEVCDEGLMNGTCGHCAADCGARLGVCGDRVITASCGEICDDGNRVNGDGCSSDCRGAETCGDGRVDPGESCDDGNSAACAGACREDCSGLYGAVCGDGVIGACEVCEDSGAGVDTGCTDASPNCSGCGRCAISACGNGVVERGEACETTGFCEGTETACRIDADCGTAQCLPYFDEGTCNATCSRVIRCGDGHIDGFEACDDGNTVDGDRCSADCYTAG